ncbi:MAG: hypothetical protein ACO1QS_15010 [Verrucomicrobiota bacterium]
MRTLTAIAPLLMFLAFTGCGISMERVPSAAEIRASKDLSIFLMEAGDIHGNYQNLDVDSTVFSYSHHIASENEFWDKLYIALKDTDWKPVDASGSIRRFERRFPKGTKAFSSAEQIRVGFKRSKAVVGYVQADSSKEQTSFAETDGAKWAERVIWPKFEALLK